ncbi:hypothetical protein TrLO_g185 [Triparma laevis f. longispina]|uniref:Kinesin light chain n=1 Tax=Triparma laevis f. longispina TaxID=1714387 RepID=A0A9W6ZNJ4_9STRA|nr:hypothetical protein TrLO_g185 [Triparma laevis f. longispina]
MPEEKKVRGKKQQKKKKNGPKKLEILDACRELGRACGKVEDFDDVRLYNKRAKDGYEEQLGRDSEKALDVTRSLIMANMYNGQQIKSVGKKIEKLRDLLKRMERALGEENVVTLETLNTLGTKLEQNGEYEEARKVYERCLAGMTEVLGEDHRVTLMTLNNLGGAYYHLKNYEKALEYFERALKAKERMFGENYPSTLGTVANLANIYSFGLKDYGKAEELYERALEGI